MGQRRHDLGDCNQAQLGAWRHAGGCSAQEALGYFRDSGFCFLPVEPEHAAAVAELPTHHADPFDRILIAQALVEPMRLITHDAMVARYNDSIIEI